MSFSWEILGFFFSSFLDFVSLLRPIIPLWTFFSPFWTIFILLIVIFDSIHSYFLKKHSQITNIRPIVSCYSKESLEWCFRKIEYSLTGKYISLSVFLVYEDLRISSDHYLKNSAKTRSFARRIDLKKFSESPQRGLWNDFSHMANIATVNAFYNQVTNTMVVPIGMLQPPLFWSRPKSLTFGAFGIVVGK